MTICLGKPLPECSSDFWGRTGNPFDPYLASGGVYIANFVAELLVRSYRAFPPLQNLAVLRYISVALSLKSPSVGVTHRLCPVMLGLSSSILMRSLD